jgi:hypothetical protein
LRRIRKFDTILLKNIFGKIINIIENLRKILYNKFMKRTLAFFALYFTSIVVFSQEIVLHDDIITENRKYSVLYYYYITYENAYAKGIIERITSMEPYSRLDLIQAYKTYENDDIIYYFSGDYVCSSNEAGTRIMQIRLTDSLTGDEERDELITDLTYGYRKLWSYDEIIETGEDQHGQYKIRKRWELGKADYFLELFKTDYWNAKNELLNIEYIDQLYDFF